MGDFQHISVLLEECIEGLDINPKGIYLDGTLGRAGHSLEIVKRLDSGKLIGIDQDQDAIEAGKEVLKDYRDKVYIAHDNYVNFDKVLDELKIDKIDGILLDLGVSSYQLDEGSRGFSFQVDAPLDMRMDQGQKLSAWTVVNEYSEKEIEDIIFNYGEDRWSRRIAQFIVKERKNHPIDTTFQLVDLIKKAIPKGARDKNPAIRTFQAIRIEVNNELGVLEDSIEKMIARLNPDGRLAIITFHSLEDRIVKNTFKYLESDCICDPLAPVCTCDKEAEIEIITRKPITPSREELNKNNRSRSAKLRIARKL